MSVDWRERLVRTQVWGTGAQPTEVHLVVLTKRRLCRQGKDLDADELRDPLVHH
jgi:hypothetical protein